MNYVFRSVRKKGRIECQSHRLTVEDPVTILNRFFRNIIAWKANAIGRNSNSMREFLEKNYKETFGQETIKLAIHALLEVVETGGKNIEVAVMTTEGLRQLAVL
ncbi:hypothetical protein L2E82_51922 [Cichorium intybus]|nr:hypothetical protein L2E82_51922 [Cichorium intybus]